MDTQNVVIIGGGAAGLSAALYLARAGLSPLVFAGSPPGGQLMLTSEVENFPGRESVLGGELIDIIRKQATKFGAIIVDENVKAVELAPQSAGRSELVGAHQNRSNRVKLVESASGTAYKTKAVIIATGARALWLGLPSETRLRGKGVSACATCDGFFFKNKTVAVIGGGDSALEEALTLTKFASKVYIIHRRAEFKASKIMQKRVFENKKIEVVWNAGVEEIIGQTRVEGVRLNRLKSAAISSHQLQSVKTDLSQSQPISADLTLKVDGVFVAIGHRPDTDLFKGKIELDQKGYVLTTAMFALEQLKSAKISPTESEGQLKPAQAKNTDLSKSQQISADFNYDYDYQTMTSVDGVFAAGDCVDHVYKQASTAAGMGVQSSLDAERWLATL